MRHLYALFYNTNRNRRCKKVKGPSFTRMRTFAKLG